MTSTHGCGSSVVGVPIVNGFSLSVAVSAAMVLSPTMKGRPSPQASLRACRVFPNFSASRVLFHVPAELETHRREQLLGERVFLSRAEAREKRGRQDLRGDG